MKAVVQLFLLAVVGGFSCWLPSIILHRLVDLDGGQVLYPLTVLMPLAALVVLHLAGRLVREGTKARAPVLLILGIWVLGPVAFYASGTMTGEVDAVLIGGSVLITFFGSAYDGSLFGLVASTVTLVVIFHVRSR